MYVNIPLILIKVNFFQITPHAFKALLQFLYTARLNVHLDHVDDVLLLAKHCKMTNLTHQIEEKKTEVESFGVCSFQTAVANVVFTQITCFIVFRSN